MITSNVPYQYINQANDEKAWATLCYWVWLRSKFQKKIYYNATDRRMADILGLSKSTTRRHIEVMLKLGWLIKSGDHLYMVKLDSFKSHPNRIKRNIIKMRVFRNRGEQIAALRQVLLNGNLFSQRKKVDRKKNVVLKAKTPHASLSKSDMKMIKKAGGVERLETSTNDRLTLTNTKIGGLIGLSKRSGSRLQVKLNQMGLLKSEAFYEDVKGPMLNLPANVFFQTGRGYVRRKANTLNPLTPHNRNRCMYSGQKWTTQNSL